MRQGADRKGKKGSPFSLRLQRWKLEVSSNQWPPLLSPWLTKTILSGTGGQGGGQLGQVAWEMTLDLGLPGWGRPCFRVLGSHLLLGSIQIWSLPPGIQGWTRQCCGCGGHALPHGRQAPDLSASLPSPDLHRSLHRPPVHKVLALLCPVRHLVLPGHRQATAGGQAHGDLPALGPVEAHEGLLPSFREYQGCFVGQFWLPSGQGSRAPHCLPRVQ